MKKIVLTAASIIFLFASDAGANIVFPAIANQFAVSFVVGFYWSVLIAALILAIETVFIKKLFSLPVFFALILSLAVNFISSVVGTLLTSFSVSGRNIFAYGNMRLGTYLGMMPGYILTILLEGALLIFISGVLRRRSRPADCFKAAVLMNFCSYLVLLAGIIIADVITSGQNFNIN